MSDNWTKYFLKSFPILQPLINFRNIQNKNPFKNYITWTLTKVFLELSETEVFEISSASCNFDKLWFIHFQFHRKHRLWNNEILKFIRKHWFQMTVMKFSHSNKLRWTCKYSTLKIIYLYLLVILTQSICLNKWDIITKLKAKCFIHIAQKGSCHFSKVSSLSFNTVRIHPNEFQVEHLVVLGQLIFSLIF